MGEQELRKLVTQVPHETALTLRKDLPALPAHRTATDSIEFRTPHCRRLCGRIVGRRQTHGTRTRNSFARHALPLEDRSRQGTAHLCRQQNRTAHYRRERDCDHPTRARYQDYHLGDYRDPVMRTERGCQLYTDRQLYRPGQRVQYSALVYAPRRRYLQGGSERQSTVKLLDSRHKKMAEQTVTTDAFGVATANSPSPNTAERAVSPCR